MAKNNKSDVKAKLAYCKYLIDQCGYESAQVVASPADIIAVKDGITWYFEIKMTKRTDTYFGAATATEWEQAFATPDTFRFVVAMTDEHEDHFEFIEFTPAQFMEACTIPPFKVYFNIDLLTHEVKRSKHRDGTVALTPSTFKRLNDAYQACKSE